MRKYIRIALLLLAGFSILKGANAQQNDSDLTGYDGFRWGDSYDDVRAGINQMIKTGGGAFPIEKLSDTPYREIRIKRGNVVYKYVFYRRPEELKRLDESPAAASETADFPTEEEQPAPTAGSNTEIARLFFVEATFSYVPSDKIYEKLSNKYGNRTAVTQTKDFRGAYLWELTNGFVIQWVDPYNQKPYTRSIYYYSKDITAEIMQDLEQYNFVEELKTVIDLLP